MDLKKQNVIVTGGGTGIGLVLAQKLAAKGSKVTISGRRAQILEQAATQTPALSFLAGDITDTDHQTKLFAAAQTHGGGPVTLLINNAGYITLTNSFPAKGGSDNEIAQLFAINCVAPLQMTRRFIEQAEDGALGGGSVVQIGSLSAQVPVEAMAIYAGTKAGLAHANAGLRTQAARSRVKLLHVQTPATETPMTKEMAVGMMDVDKMTDRILAGIEAERREIRPSLECYITGLGNRIWPAIPKWIADRRYRDFP
ncbi:MAG: SDR family NAD(P)-dependent oxidoreductase [Pseudomonadota bacterium]